MINLQEIKKKKKKNYKIKDKLTNSCSFLSSTLPAFSINLNFTFNLACSLLGTFLVLLYTSRAHPKQFYMITLTYYYIRSCGICYDQAQNARWILEAREIVDWSPEENRRRRAETVVDTVRLSHIVDYGRSGPYGLAIIGPMAVQAQFQRDTFSPFVSGLCLARIPSIFPLYLVTLLYLM